MSETRLIAKLKRMVFQRANGCCEYCRSQVEFCPDPFSIEHIIPRILGGLFELLNLALSCQGCNNHKFICIAAVDVVTGEMVPLYHPRQQRWSEHFAWNGDGSLLIGLTPTGRVTIERLQLNRRGVVNLRRMLFATNQHPPADPEP